MIFCDWITLTHKHKNARPLAGLRTLSYREEGDINRAGESVEAQEVVGDRAHWAWVQGSHDTRIRVLSFDGLCCLSGNAGRFGRSDNVFNFDFFDTVQAANRIMEREGLPAFHVGEPCGAGKHVGDEIQWSGSRVWSVHLTQNYATGSAANARHVINWLDGQTVARVKKSRLGASTVAWGSLKYCQTEVYVKADEMLAHAKSQEERERIAASELYHWVRDNGVIRVEVKAAKDYLKYKGLTFLGSWTMDNVTRLFEERTEVLRRCRVEVDELDAATLPRQYRAVVAAWLKGEDVTRLYSSRTTLWRHAKFLRGYGIDILEHRNIASMPVNVRAIDLVPLAVPEWYPLAA